MGDGALVEFPSVVEAVECAVDIQSGMVEREAGRSRAGAHPLPHRHQPRRRADRRRRSLRRRRQHRRPARRHWPSPAASCSPPPPSIRCAASCRWRFATSASGLSRTSPGRCMPTPSASAAAGHGRRGATTAWLVCAAARRGRGVASVRGRLWALAGAGPPSPSADAQARGRAAGRSPCCRSRTSPIRPMPISATA